MNMDAAIRDLWEDGAIEEGAIQQISQILSRIASSLKQIESYDDLIDQFIFGEEGQWGEDSMIGSSEPVNIIPCDHGNGSCREVLLAFAKGRRSPKQGLKSVMRQVREHMIRCNQTRIVIIFTDTWDLDVFSESFGDFQAHRECMPPKTIIGALVNGSRITPQSIG